MRPEAVAFDMLGTVFRLDPLERGLRALGLPEGATSLLYATAQRTAFALAATGDFVPFRTLLEDALDFILRARGLEAEAASRASVLDRMAELPPRDDALDAFAMLREAGVRGMALTNGAADFTRKLLAQEGLGGLLDPVLSVEDIGVYKPRREIYRHAAQQAGAAPDRVALVAIHAWDINGAIAAGLRGAYVSVQGPYPGFMRKPDVVAPSLQAAVQALLAMP